MVHYEDMFIEYPSTDMYSRTHYSPTTANMFNTTTSASGTYETTTYNTTVPTTDNVSYAGPYYEQGYRPPYWQQPPTVKDEAGMPPYQQPNWPAYHTRDGVDMYKPPQEYFTLQNTAHGGHNSPAGVGAQYAPCAVMSTMSQQQAMEEEMVKERHSQAYNGWVSGSNSTNCKTRTKDKYRVVYSDHQRLELEKEFHYSRYITIRRKAELAVTLNLSERQVKIWFQNRRAKERKMNKKKSGDDSKSTTEGESRSSPGSTDCNDEEEPSASEASTNVEASTNAEDS